MYFICVEVIQSVKREKHISCQTLSPTQYVSVIFELLRTYSLKYFLFQIAWISVSLDLSLYVFVTKLCSILAIITKVDSVPERSVTFLLT